MTKFHYYISAALLVLLVGVYFVIQHINAPPTLSKAEIKAKEQAWIDVLAGIDLTVQNPEKREEWNCLTEALYFEARGEPLLGQVAVAEVILNRADSKRFPDTVCDVVNQGASRKTGCQFSYKCDGIDEIYKEPDAYNDLRKIAKQMLGGNERELTKGATFYHNKTVHPKWAKKLKKTVVLGEHLFYSF